MNLLYGKFKPSFKLSFGNMAEYFEDAGRFDLIKRLHRREQIVKDRPNPITYYNDADIWSDFG